MKNTINLTVNGHQGSSEVKWFEDSKWSVAHYGAFISVPFQDSRWEHLYIFDKSDIDGATKKAEQYLTCALERCTLA